MFEKRKKYDSKNFIIIRKEQIIENKAYRPRPYLPWSTFNYSIRTTFNGAKNYSLAFKIDNKYLDLFNLEIYSEFDAFNNNTGDEVITEKEQLVETESKLTCYDAINLFLRKKEKSNNLEKYNETELTDIKKNAVKAIKKLKNN